jgi:F-type H+-transporting ATPase subunit b
MNIDIAVLVTNILGFLLVLWILRKYAWGPILSFLEERRRHIADEFSAIDRDKAEAEQLKSEFHDQLAEIDNLKRTKIQEGASEAQELADSIKGDARREAQELRERARADAQREQEKARIQLRDHIVDMTVRSSEKLIREKLNDSKHRDLISKFIEDLGRAS